MDPHIPWLSMPHYHVGETKHPSIGVSTQIQLWQEGKTHHQSANYEIINPSPRLQSSQPIFKKQLMKQNPLEWDW
jgi:hypothetical protein